MDSRIIRVYSSHENYCLLHRMTFFVYYSIIMSSLSLTLPILFPSSSRCKFHDEAIASVNVSPGAGNRFVSETLKESPITFSELNQCKYLTRESAELQQH